ncbi:hypothetical protein ISCGN_001493 [Ixodes scapularis]
MLTAAAPISKQASKTLFCVRAYVLVWTARPAHVSRMDSVRLPCSLVRGARLYEPANPACVSTVARVCIACALKICPRGSGGSALGIPWAPPACVCSAQWRPFQGGQNACLAPPL